jgi:rhodanese-related sulfurtransferase
MKWIDKGLIFEVIVIALFTAVIAFPFNARNPNGVPLKYEKRILKVAENLDDPASDSGKTIPIAIKMEQAEELYFQRNIQFIDARLPEDFKLGHISKSINIPVEKFGNYMQTVEQLPKLNPYVTYCSGTDCNLAEELADSLINIGFKKIYVFYDGWKEWNQLDRPVEKGDN